MFFLWRFTFFFALEMCPMTRSGDCRVSARSSRQSEPPSSWTLEMCQNPCSNHDIHVIPSQFHGYNLRYELCGSLREVGSDSPCQHWLLAWSSRQLASVALACLFASSSNVSSFGVSSLLLISRRLGMTSIVLGRCQKPSFHLWFCTFFQNDQLFCTRPFPLLVLNTSFEHMPS